MSQLLPDEQVSSEPGVRSAPLVTQEGKRFLSGAVSADDYFSDQRKRAQQEAAAEVRDAGGATSKPWLTFAVIATLSYVVVAVYLFIAGAAGVALTTLITSLLIGAALPRLWPLRNRSRISPYHRD